MKVLTQLQKDVIHLIELKKENNNITSYEIQMELKKYDIPFTLNVEDKFVTHNGNKKKVTTTYLTVQVTNNKQFTTII